MVKPMRTIRALVRNSTSNFLLSSHFLPELTIDDLSMVYRDFNGIYTRHIGDAKFDAVKGTEFKSLKKRLIEVLHLLGKYPELAPEKRTELIQAILSEDNLQRAQQVFPKPDKDHHSGKASLFSRFTEFFSGSKETDEESLRKELREKTSGVPDSKFLLQLKGVDDKDLEPPIQAAVDLACGQLASSIDSAAKKMTHSVLRMQQDECRRSLQREVEMEERKVFGGMLLDFIRAINQLSTGRRTS